ncbi:sugar phosphate isomerase/epimerase family protein [Rhizobium jaguaris]|uniref:Xylose isomerase n=1 Tax=Rhizobium jaguaris TaxID=1312183 RepID=A0A387FZG3_9HYPH|nr:sugar phosphate isomerase/epimerase [Rhizobium jaguaris]AYG63037.1 xylose isomerase [Rhizobium jaguaris]
MSDLSPRVTADGYRIAINPIQWLASEDGFLDRSKAPPLDDFLAQIRQVGFPAAVIAIPVGTSLEDYKAAFERAGILPAPSYFGIPSPEAEVPLEKTLEEAKLAGSRQAALGLKDIFIAVHMPPKLRPRVDKPAVGAMFDQARLDFIIDQLGNVAEALKAEGVMPALHPHVGTWIETENDTRRTLDTIGPGTLNFGPDSGHLSWAGADVLGLFRSYRDRISIMHIKDIRLDVRDAAIAAGKSYPQTALDGLWAEPGIGNLDIKAMLTELGPSFDGWIVAEVDRPTMPPYESAVVSANYLRELRRPSA